MNTFRRPMFRGGPVDSRGTGITSGLSYNKGGRVGYEPGGQVTTGGSLMDRIRSANSLFFNDPARFAPGFDRTQPKTFLGMNIPGTGSALNPVPFETRNFAEDMMFVTGPGKFLKAGGGGLQLFKEMGRRNIAQGKDLVPFKEAPFLSNQYFRNILQPYTSGMKETLKGSGQSIKDFGIIGALGLGGGTYGLGKMYEGFKERQKTENPLEDEPEKKELSAAEIENLELKKLLEELTKTKTAKETDMEESVEIDKEKFAKVLGKDKARGQDIADMLLSFSSKALAPEATVKSAFAEFAADEVKRPSRARKIEDSAAALAINKYIKGEISKQEAEAFLNRAKVQSDLIKERGEKSIGEYYAASQSPTFAGRVKDAAIAYFPTPPKFEVVESKDMKSVEEGGKFKFSAEDIGVIFIETDTRESYTFDRGGNRVTVING
jgi:hypothetical protein